MDYKTLKPEEVKKIEDENLQKIINDNDLAHKETVEELNTKKAEIENLKKENEDLKKNQKDPEPEKTADELIKELF